MVSVGICNGFFVESFLIMAGTFVAGMGSVDPFYAVYRIGIKTDFRDVPIFAKWVCVDDHSSCRMYQLELFFDGSIFYLRVVDQPVNINSINEKFCSVISCFITKIDVEIMCIAIRFCVQIAFAGVITLLFFKRRKCR